MKYALDQGTADDNQPLAFKLDLNDGRISEYRKGKAVATIYAIYKLSEATANATDWIIKGKGRMRS